MVTPAFVLTDQAAVRRIAKQVRQSGRANQICGLVDLQSGRPYIFPGRTATELAPQTIRNLRIVLDEGVCPLIIIRNDWAARTQTGTIPSVGGPIQNDRFYATDRLQTERTFIRSLAWLFPHAAFQLQLEPSSTHSASFAVGLAQEFRAAGYTGPLYINPFDTSVPGHEQRRQQFAGLNVVWARSHHGTAPTDPVWNTDGNRRISAANAREWSDRLDRSGKPTILWSAELAQVSDRIPAAYL